MEDQRNNEYDAEDIDSRLAGELCAIKLAVFALMASHPDKQALASRLSLLVEGATPHILNSQLRERYVQSFQDTVAELQRLLESHQVSG